MLRESRRAAALVARDRDPAANGGEEWPSRSQDDLERLPFAERVAADPGARAAVARRRPPEGPASFVVASLKTAAPATRTALRGGRRRALRGQARGQEPDGAAPRAPVGRVPPRSRVGDILGGRGMGLLDAPSASSELKRAARGRPTEVERRGQIRSGLRATASRIPARGAVGVAVEPAAVHANRGRAAEARPSRRPALDLDPRGAMPSRKPGRRAWSRRARLGARDRDSRAPEPLGPEGEDASRDARIPKERPSTTAFCQARRRATSTGH